MLFMALSVLLTLLVRKTHLGQQKLLLFVFQLFSCQNIAEMLPSMQVVLLYNCTVVLMIGLTAQLFVF